MKSGSLTYDEIVVACRNVGIDIMCDACAAQFYTGSVMSEKHSCNPPIRHREQLLGDALRRVLVRAGVLREDAAVSGPELLLAADVYVENK